MHKAVQSAWNRLRAALSGDQPGDKSTTFDETLKQLGVSSWTRRVLIQHGIESVDRLIRLTHAELAEIKNLGRSSVAEITRVTDRLQGLDQPEEDEVEFLRQETTQPAASTPVNEVVIPSAEPTAPILTGGCPWDRRSVDDLKLHKSVRNALRGAGIELVGQLLRLSYRELKQLDGIGEHYARLIDWALTQRCLALRTVPKAPRQGVSTAQRQSNEVDNEPLAEVSGDDAEQESYSAETQEEFPPAWAEEPIEALDLSKRSYNALKRSQIKTLGELSRLSEADLYRIRNLGVTSIREIIRKRAEFRHAIDRGQMQPVAASMATVPSDPDCGDGVVSIPVVALGLSVRPARVLMRIGVTRTSELCSMTREQLLAADGLGGTSLREIERVLAGHGLGLKESLALPLFQEPTVVPDSLEAWLDVCLDQLDSRRKEVIVLRYGLLSGHPLTLEETGNIIGVTRERIRQIEMKAMRPLYHRNVKQRLEVLSCFYAERVASNGGVMTTSDLAADLGARYPAGKLNSIAFARFTLPLCRGIEEFDDDLWVLPDLNRHQYRCIERGIQNYLTKVGHPLPCKDLLLHMGKELAAESEATPLIRACLRTSPKLRLVGEWCLLSMWERSEKAAWVLATLYHLGRPAHFTRVTSAVGSLAPQIGEMTDHSVHSMLLRLPEAVRTGAGTFALRSWGIQGEVSDPPVGPQRGYEVQELADPVDDIMNILFPKG